MRKTWNMSIVKNMSIAKRKKKSVGKRRGANLKKERRRATTTTKARSSKVPIHRKGHSSKFCHAEAKLTFWLFGFELKSAALAVDHDVVVVDEDVLHQHLRHWKLVHVLAVQLPVPAPLAPHGLSFVCQTDDWENDVIKPSALLSHKCTCIRLLCQGCD